MSISIYCKNISKYIDVAGGETLQSIADKIGLNFKPICARVNNKTESMGFEVYHSKLVEFLDRTEDSGPRVYTRSLCMLLYKAVHTVLPQAILRIEHSISHGYYCTLSGVPAPTEEIVSAIESEMRRLVDADLPFEAHELLTADVIDIFERLHLDEKVALLKTTHPLYTKFYTLDGLSDSYYGVLAPSTGFLKVFALKAYHEGMLLLSFDPANPSQTPEAIVQDKMFRAFTDYQRFNEIIGVSTVGHLNMVVENHKEADLINVAEALHEKALARISDEITERYHKGGARIVLISGPSSSGKTTTCKRLATQLMTNLLKPQMISLDNYFVDRVNTPRDASGDYDYESLYALNLERFNRDLTDILAGKEVALPTYNFETGRSEERGNTIKLTDGCILLIEGIHGLNPELTADIPEKQKYRLYVSALTTLSIDEHNWVPTTDNRLLRRIVRDFDTRGASAIETIRRWPSVRRGEERWIFPYQENADATFNSSLIYELAVMKSRAETVLKTIPSDVVEYSEAYRLRKFLSYFVDIPLHLIPSTSLLREFLGGSSFKY